MSSVSCCTICNSISLFPSRPIPHHPTSSHLSHHSYIFISLGFTRMLLREVICCEPLQDARRQQVVHIERADEYAVAFHHQKAANMV